MLDNDNIISKTVSEAVEKIPADEKDYRNAPLCVLLCTATAYKQHTNIANSRSSCLPSRLHPVLLKKFTEEILHKFTQKNVK